MHYLWFAFALLLRESSGALTLTTDSWSKRDSDLDLSNLVLWKEFLAVSRVGCLLKCHNVFSSGCGYHRNEKLCHVFVDWDRKSKWTQVEGMDYYVSASVSTEEWVDLRGYGLSSAMLIGSLKLTWPNAKSHCEQLGGQLLIMDTAEKRQALIDHFKQKDMKLCCNYWLGLSDTEKEGQWMWINDEPVEKQYWDSMQPDNLLSQDCGVLKGKTKFKMDDLKCTTSLKFMCEKSLGQ